MHILKSIPSSQEPECQKPHLTTYIIQGGLKNTLYITDARYKLNVLFQLLIVNPNGTLCGLLTQDIYEIKENPSGSAGNKKKWHSLHGFVFPNAIYGPKKI